MKNLGVTVTRTVPYFQIHHPSEKSAGVKTFAAEEEDRDHAAFPTLETALTALDSHCGFNIEIKFSQQYKVGTVPYVRGCDSRYC